MRTTDPGIDATPDDDDAACCLLGPPTTRRRALLGFGAALTLGPAARAGAAPPAPVAAAPGAGRQVPALDRGGVLEAGAALVLRDGVPELRRDVSIVIEAGRIAEIRNGRIAGRQRRVDASRWLVLPGFISCHTHVCGGSVTRALFEGRRSFQRPLELVERLDDEQLDALTAWNLAELLRSGCTTQLDQALSLRQARSYVRIARRWGVRAYPAGMVPGIARLFPIWQRRNDDLLRDSVPGTLAEIAANLEFARSVDGAEGGLIRPMMAPHATDTHTPETLAAVLDAARSLGHGIHLHLAQSSAEAASVQRLWGARPVEWLERLGLLDERVFGAHMTGLDLAQDPAILRRHRFTYATCPSAGGASGFTQPWPELLAAGVNTNIGIDTHSNDYVENLKLAVIKGEARWSLTRRTSAVPMQRPTLIDALRAATLDAARGLGRDDLGRIAPGAQADLIAIDVAGPLVGSGALSPEPLYNLLYANGTAVRHVLTAGRLQLFDGRLVVDDEARVAAAAAAAMQQLWALLRADGYFD
jgi:cytosine/adenosine deaminase-related metal-dependent hydrolase